jgi:hypothetical protein
MNHQVYLLVFLLIFSLVLLCALCWPHPGPAPSRAAAKIRARLQRLLKPRRLESQRMLLYVLARGQKPAGSSQACEHRRLRLFQPNVPLLWHHR